MGELQQLFEEYISGCRYSARLSKETIRGYEAVFILFLKVMPEVTELKDLIPEMLNEFFKRIQERTRIVGRDKLKIGVKNSTIKTQWTKINVFLKWLKENNHIKENPLERIKPPRVIYDDYRRLEDSDIRKIYTAIVLHSANPFMQRRDTMIVSILLFCGLRRGELLGLQVKDIDAIKREITIRGETSKSKRTRILRIHPTLLLHIRDYLRERNIRRLRTEYLIVSNREDSGLSYEGMIHWVNKMIKISGVQFHLHMFRHTFACKLAETGVNLFRVQKLMGHTDIRMTAKYARSMRTEDMEEDIAKISV
jgi:integrase/recombinase XerD